MLKISRLQGLRAFANMDPTGAALGCVWSWLPLSSLSPFWVFQFSEIWAGIWCGALICNCIKLVSLQNTLCHILNTHFIAHFIT